MMLGGTKVPENEVTGSRERDGSGCGKLESPDALLSAWAPLALGCLSPRPWDRVAPQGKRKL